MFRQIVAGIALVFFSAAGPALGCSIPPPPPMTEEEKAAEAERYRQEFLDRGRNAEAIVRVKALSSSGYGESTAVVKVLKTFRGKIRRGTVLRLKTVDSAMCGWGDLKRGEHGVIVLDEKKARYFKGFLWEKDIQEYRKEGILPAED